MNTRTPSPMPPELLEPARAQPDFDAMDDMGDYAQAVGREALEGMLVVECPEVA